MKKLLALVVLGLVSSPAVAADLGGQGGYKDDVVSPCAGVSWTGFRVGALVGVGSTGTGSGTGTESYVNDAGHTVTRTGDLSGNYQLNTVGQIEVGGDWQFKNSGLVIGAFGDLGYGFGTSELTYSLNGRVGFAAGNALFYGFGGVEKAHLVHDLSTLSGTTLATLKADPTGFVYGLGIDVSLGRGWYAGVRAERVDYGTFTAKGSSGGYSYTASTSGTDDRGFLTLGYKF